LAAPNSLAGGGFYPDHYLQCSHFCTGTKVFANLKQMNTLNRLTSPEKNIEQDVIQFHGKMKAFFCCHKI
jgi:hypothetical protein